MSKAVILMIEDNSALLRTNRAQLEAHGYRVLEADTLAKGLELARTEKPDLILLDILLPDGNGLAHCRELLGQEKTRILFLSALDTKGDVIAGLRAGGDDYITKPYLMDEMLARVEVLLRRSGGAPRDSAPLHVGALELSIASGRAYLNGNDLLLTPKELFLLDVLLRHRGQFLAGRALYERVWGVPAMNARTVKQHMRNLRNKLGPTAPVRIESEQGRGYRIVEVEEDRA